MSSGICLERLPPPGKSSASLGKGLGKKHLVTTGMAWCPVSHIALHSVGWVTNSSLTDCVRKREVNQKTWCPSFQKENAQASSFSQGSLVVSLIFDLFKFSKITIKFFDFFKVSKITVNFLTCSKSAKMVRVKCLIQNQEQILT